MMRQRWIKAEVCPWEVSSRFLAPRYKRVIVPKELLIGGPASLVVFMCNHSPYVKHIREVLVKVIWEYQQRGISVVAINPNDINLSPEDCPNRMKEEARLYGYTFPYLFDGTQALPAASMFYSHPIFVFDREENWPIMGRWMTTDRKTTCRNRKRPQGCSQCRYSG